MILIKKETHDGYYHELQEQSWQSENWLGDEWLEVPEGLRGKVWACAGCCDLVVESGELADVIERERPPEPEAEPALTVEEQIERLRAEMYAVLVDAGTVALEAVPNKIRDTVSAEITEISKTGRTELKKT